MPLLRRFALLLALVGATGAHALTPADVRQLRDEDSDAKIEAIRRIAATKEPAALALLGALQEGELYLGPNDTLMTLREGVAKDALSGAVISGMSENPESVAINNRVRRELAGALAGLRLSMPERAVRLAAAKELQAGADEDVLPTIQQALDHEQDPDVRSALTLGIAQIQMKSADPAVRLGAVKALAQSASQTTKTLLAALAERRADGTYAEPDEKVRVQAQVALREVEQELSRIEWLGHAFTGLSLGSVLLLAALGLAITFGLMGIINMAHGEMLMIGAYATYVTQNVFRDHLPGAVDWYLPVAVPISFLCAAAIGMALERGVIRFLYGRPLETLLCTWGISLILIQSVRTLFGAQNVEVANPSWMSGGIALASGLTLPYNRIAIIAFAAFVVALVWLLLSRTRLGLFVRAVQQNRTMADCVGVHTGRIDMWTFGIGSGIAGLGGCALSQIGNVGPDLGQAYIVDSFMVVVLGGVGNLLGTILAAVGLGEVNKFLEPYAGAVLGKIFVLVFIIFFIQKRPQGLFAIKGRSVEAMA
jgi:urea transport system permease protein